MAIDSRAYWRAHVAKAQQRIDEEEADTDGPDNYHDFKLRNISRS